jgi:hypothetical protein
MDWNAGGSVSGPQSGGNGGPVIVELPLDKIRRPLLRTRANDPHKVKELMDSIQEIGLQVPVSILLLCFLYLTFFCILIVFVFQKITGSLIIAALSFCALFGFQENEWELEEFCQLKAVFELWKTSPLKVEGK